MDRVVQWTLSAILLVSLGLNIALSQAVARDRAELQRLRSALLRMKEDTGLRIGQQLPPIQAEDSTGAAWKVSYQEAGGPTLLYVFSPSCGWCQRNLSNVRALAEQLQSRVRVLGLTTSKIPMEQRSGEVAALGFPVLFDVSPDTIAQYRFGGTPQTLLVSAEGKVLRNWVGAYAGSMQKEIEESLEVKLPGLQDL